MKRLLALAAIALLCTSCSKSPEDAYQALKDKAAEQLANYEFDQADSTYIEVLFADTTRFDGPLGLARSAELQLMNWDALHLYMKISERNPRSAEAAMGMMRVATRLGFDELALDRAGTAMELAGGSDGGEAAVETARRLIPTRQPHVARQLTARILDAGQPRTVADWITARAFYREHKFDSAAVYHDRALAESAGGSLVDQVAADYFETTGQFDSAMTFSEAAWNSARDDFDVTVEHFRRALRLGYYNDARQAVRKIEAEGGGTAPAFMLRIQFQWGTGQLYEAMATAVYLSQVRPHTLTNHLVAIEANRRVSNFITCSAEMQYVENMLARGNLTSSFVDFMRYRLAIINSGLDDQRIPLQQLQAQAQNRTTEMDHRTREAYLLYRIGAVDEFNAKADSILDLYGDNVEWLAAIGDVFADSTIMLYDRARTTYEKALELDPWYRPAVEGYIDMYRHRHLYDSALVVIDRYENLQDNYADFRVERAFFLTLAGQPEAGVDFFGESIQPLSGSLPRWERMFNALQINLAGPQLTELADHLRELTPQDPDATVLVARDLERREEFDQLLQLTANALSENPDHPDLHAHHAWALFKTGEEDDAFDEFEELKETNEDNSELLYLYSRALAESGRDPDEAQNQARRSVFSGPEVYRDFMNLAYIYMLTGRPDLARGEAYRAQVAFPNRPEAYYYQGYSLYLENEEGAKELLQKALDLGLIGDDAQRARDALQAL